MWSLEEIKLINLLAEHHLESGKPVPMNQTQPWGRTLYFVGPSPAGYRLVEGIIVRWDTRWDELEAFENWVYDWNSDKYALGVIAVFEDDMTVGVFEKEKA